MSIAGDVYGGVLWCGNHRLAYGRHVTESDGFSYYRVEVFDIGTRQLLPIAVDSDGAWPIDCVGGHLLYTKGWAASQVFAADLDRYSSPEHTQISLLSAGWRLYPTSPNGEWLPIQSIANEQQRIPPPETPTVGPLSGYGDCAADNPCLTPLPLDSLDLDPDSDDRVYSLVWVGDRHVAVMTYNRGGGLGRRRLIVARLDSDARTLRRISTIAISDDLEWIHEMNGQDTFVHERYAGNRTLLEVCKLRDDASVDCAEMPYETVLTSRSPQWRQYRVSLVVPLADASGVLTTAGDDRGPCLALVRLDGSLNCLARNISREDDVDLSFSDIAPSPDGKWVAYSDGIRNWFGEVDDYIQHFYLVPMPPQ